ncbi:MAG: class I SAM-dependent methyltransferase [Desulfovibrionaceae bacterium]
MRDRIPFSQLWIEEEQYLWTLGDTLSGAAVVVEIGSGQGGSAYIFAHTAGALGARIHTHDIAPARELYDNLRGLPVDIRAMSSAEGAARWDGTPIDVLFIDGGHTFIDVYTDFALWARFLRPGGKVLFHDYDPPARGGVPHLGVRLFCDTLRGAGALADVAHEGRLLIGRVDSPQTALPDMASFAETWTTWGESLRRLIAARRPGLMANALPGKAAFVREFLGASVVVDPKTFDGDLLLVMDRPFTTATQALLEGGVAAAYVDDWMVGYLVQEALGSNRDLLLNRVADRSVLFKYNELNEMMASGAGRAYSLDAVFAHPPRNLEALSAHCAHELVRLHFMEQIAGTLEEKQTGAVPMAAS